jgi:hypothetical protein
MHRTSALPQSGPLLEGEQPVKKSINTQAVAINFNRTEISLTLIFEPPGTCNSGMWDETIRINNYHKDHQIESTWPLAGGSAS